MSDPTLLWKKDGLRISETGLSIQLILALYLKGQKVTYVREVCPGFWVLTFHLLDLFLISLGHLVYIHILGLHLGALSLLSLSWLQTNTVLRSYYT